MGLDVQQFRNFIVRPTLSAINLYSKSAEHLIVGTALIESDMEYIYQVPAGPAVSILQMEPETYKDVRKRLYTQFKQYLQPILDYFAITEIPTKPAWLIGNLYAAVTFARLKYYYDKEPLPKEDDWQNLAGYYKRVYNTHLGKATIRNAEIIFKSVISQR